MNQHIIHHRTEKFERIFHDCKEGLAWLLDAKHAPLLLACSGTGAFEAAIENFFSPKDTILCITGGKFADNWLKLSQIFGLNAIEIPVAWGDAVSVDQVKDALTKHPHARGVIVVASETSTGVRHPYEEIGAVIKEYADCLYVVDGVTALGVFDIAPEQQHIDVLVAGSQKGLMLPPGLGFLWASDKAWSMRNRAHLPRFYFDLAKEQKAQQKNQTSYTPAVSLIMGLKESLIMMREEGREAIFARHDRLARACRAAILALGLKLFAKQPTQAITSVYSPEGLPPDAIYEGLMDLANFTIAGGQEQLSGKVFRIGHMGYVDEIDLIGVLGALEIVLKRLGFEKFHTGASLAAASSILQAGFMPHINGQLKL
jgi:aspartate aminotransferase-like enzyme